MQDMTPEDESKELMLRVKSYMKESKVSVGNVWNYAS